MSSEPSTQPAAQDQSDVQAKNTNDETIFEQYKELVII